MRTPFLFALLVSAALGAVVWYQQTAYECPTPLAYRIGEIDPSFELPRERATSHVADAVAVWEREFERDLFRYDDRADFTINFIFDERQEAADAEAEQRQDLDSQQETNEEILERIDSLQNEFETLAAEYEARVAIYEDELAAYNALVANYNEEGGAPPEAFAELEAERQRLNAESDALAATTAELNGLVTELNTLNSEGSERIDAYNEDVQAYNDRFGYSREFTQGDYQGDSINIYTFSSDTELETVLAHEFGHALGIDHVEEPSALMYYLMDDTDSAPTLDAADIAAFLETCGAEPTFAQRVRSAVRSVLMQF